MSKDRPRSNDVPKLRSRFRFRFQKRSSNAWLVSHRFGKLGGDVCVSSCGILHEN
jgi:hypothetical protein